MAMVAKAGKMSSLTCFLAVFIGTWIVVQTSGLNSPSPRDAATRWLRLRSPSAAEASIGAFHSHSVRLAVTSASTSVSSAT